MISVELENVFGNDLMVVNAARVSYGKTKFVFDEKDEKLISFLTSGKKKHTAPFRHPQLQFRITCPIYVERQLFKHTVGLTANSISGRYVDFSDSYTKITDFENDKWKTQSKDSKQGSGEPLSEELQTYCNMLEISVIDKCKETYDKLIGLGVSKEQARTVLPMSLNTTFIWTGSLLAFIHLWSLRLEPDAQYETRCVCNLMLKCVESLPNQPFKHSLKAFNIESI